MESATRRGESIGSRRQFCCGEEKTTMSKLYRIIDDSNNLCIALEMSRVEGSVMGLAICSWLSRFSCHQ